MSKACFQNKCDLTCSDCSEEFKSKSDLSNHSCNAKLGLEITIKTEEASNQEGNHDVEVLDDNSFRCKICRKIFKSSKGCKIHISSHLKENREIAPDVENFNVAVNSKSADSKSLCPSKPSGVKSSQRGLKAIESKVNQEESNSSTARSANSQAALSSVLKIRPRNVAASKSAKRASIPSKLFSPLEPKFQSVQPNIQHNLHKVSVNRKDLEDCKKHYVCSLCNKKFKKLRDYRGHYKTHNIDCEPSTADCKSLAPDFQSLLTDSNPLTVDCESLTTVGKPMTTDFESVTVVDKPLTANHKSLTAVGKPLTAKLHKCPNCGETFKKAGSFRRHLRSHLNIAAYSCKHCLLSFFKKSQLIVHVRQKCRYEEKKYRCIVCKKRFYHRMEFMQHKIEHVNEPPHKCPTCGALFHSISRLVRHLAHHSVKCPVCCKPFSSDFQLWQHLTTIHSDVVDCDVHCDVSEEEEEDTDQSHSDFNEIDTDSDADSFTSIESDTNGNEETIKPKTSIRKCLKMKNSHVCFICERRFSKQSSLNFHMKSHEIFTCALCYEFFPHESELKVHQSYSHESQLNHYSDKVVDSLLHSLQMQQTTSVPMIAAASVPMIATTSVPMIANTAAELSEKNPSERKGEESGNPHNILDWYNSFNELLGNLQFPIGHDLYLDINRNISEMTSALYSDNLSQETRDTYKKIYLRLTGIIRKNAESLCG